MNKFNSWRLPIKAIIDLCDLKKLWCVKDLTCITEENFLFNLLTPKKLRFLYKPSENSFYISMSARWRPQALCIQLVIQYPPIIKLNRIFEYGSNFHRWWFRITFNSWASFWQINFCCKWEVLRMYLIKLNIYTHIVSK